MKSILCCCVAAADGADERATEPSPQFVRTIVESAIEDDDNDATPKVSRKGRRRNKKEPSTAVFAVPKIGVFDCF